MALLGKDGKLTNFIRNLFNFNSTVSKTRDETERKTLGRRIIDRFNQPSWSSIKKKYEEEERKAQDVRRELISDNEWSTMSDKQKTAFLTNTGLNVPKFNKRMSKARSLEIIGNFQALQDSGYLTGNYIEELERFFGDMPEFEEVKDIINRFVEEGRDKAIRAMFNSKAEELDIRYFYRTDNGSPVRDSIQDRLWNQIVLYWRRAANHYLINSELRNNAADVDWKQHYKHVKETPRLTQLEEVGRRSNGKWV